MVKNEGLTGRQNDIKVHTLPWELGGKGCGTGIKGDRETDKRCTGGEVGVRQRRRVWTEKGTRYA
jgi:hypothetical protein